MPETLMAAEIRETPEAVTRFLDREIGRPRRARVETRRSATRRSSSPARAAHPTTPPPISNIFARSCSASPSPRSALRSPRSTGRRCALPAASSSRSRNRARAPTSSRCRRRRGRPAPSPSRSSTTPPRRSPPRRMRRCRCMPASSGASPRPRPSSPRPPRSPRSSPNGAATGRCAAPSGRCPPPSPSALDADWSSLEPVLAKAASAYVLGRGPALPIAAEAALKLKETAVLHAEAFSRRRGHARAAATRRLGLPGAGASARATPPMQSMGEAMTRLGAAGGQVFVAEAGAAGTGRLPFTAKRRSPARPAWRCSLSFYGVAETVARGARPRSRQADPAAQGDGDALMAMQALLQRAHLHRRALP